jgi:hypothetical protein
MECFESSALSPIQFISHKVSYTYLRRSNPGKDFSIMEQTHVHQ